SRREWKNHSLPLKLYQPAIVKMNVPSGAVSGGLFRNRAALERLACVPVLRGIPSGAVCASVLSAETTNFGASLYCSAVVFGRNARRDLRHLSLPLSHARFISSATVRKKLVAVGGDW